MKKLIVLIIFGTLIFISCTTKNDSKIADINYQYIGIENLSRDDYEILGRLTGFSSVSQNLSTSKLTGDTFEYGYLGDIDLFEEKKYSPVTKTVLSSEIKDREVVARKNALYKLIQKANELNADSIIFVKTMVEEKIDSNTITCNVTVSGLAIRIK